MAESILKGSVGMGGANASSDVRLVQKLLSAVPQSKGGPMPTLDEDGICGPMSCGAIRRFQAHHFGSGDGRIDPGFGTEEKLLAVLRELGRLADLLRDKPTVPKPETPPVKPEVPPAKGISTPIRQRFMNICKQLLPPKGTLTPGVGPSSTGATGCGELPGRVFRHVPVLLPHQPGAFKVKVTVPGWSGHLYLTSPMTAWESFARTVDRKYPPARTWIPFAGNRPRPGDIYVLGKLHAPAAFQHVGIIVDAQGSTWTTADGGQGNGWQSGFVGRTFHGDGQIDGEFGNKARLRGWVDLDALFAVAVAAFPNNL